MRKNCASRRELPFETVPASVPLWYCLAAIALHDSGLAQLTGTAGRTGAQEGPSELSGDVA